MDLMDRFVEERCDDIGQAVSGRQEFSARFDEACQLSEALKVEVGAGIAERMEELYAALMGIVEREFYLAGLLDGMRLQGCRQS